MCNHHRRQFLYRAAAGSLLLTPLTTILPAFATSAAPVAWGRDACARCKMAIKDFQFAAQIQGGAGNPALSFDDLGCMVLWLRDKLEENPWMAADDTRLWVTEMNSPLDNVLWLDARAAHYINVRSPMGFNFGALGGPQTGAKKNWTFAEARQHILTKGKERHD